MSEYIVELDSKHSVALRLAFFEEMRGGDFVRGEIVRCRDCKHCKKLGVVVPECWAWSEPHRTTLDSFCSFGEKWVQE